VSREVGYCQGSAFIVGLLLMQMPEEESFAVLVKIMQDYRMREMFKPSMAELGLCMYQAWGQAFTDLEIYRARTSNLKGLSYMSRIDRKLYICISCKWLILHMYMRK